MSRDKLMWAYREMLRVRGFETRAEALFAAGKFQGSTHAGIGQEAVAVGARAALETTDKVAATYRGHAYALAWGVGSYEGFCELLGRADGPFSGRGGSKHLGSVQHGVFPANAIVGAQLPIAVGSALRARMKGHPDVTVAVMGDGATNQAVFHEAMNLAAVWDLPVIFLCENNLYSEMTPIRDAVRVERLAVRAGSYGMPGVTVDGMRVDVVAETVAQAARRCRSGEGPTFIEALTYRYCGHMSGDSGSYRTEAEVADWRERDAIEGCGRMLIEHGVAESSLTEIRVEVERELDDAQERALAAALPDPTTIGLGSAPWMTSSR